MAKRDQNHWIASEKTRKWFYKFIQDVYGLSGDDLKRKLKIKSAYDLPNTGDTKRDIQWTLWIIEGSGGN